MDYISIMIVSMAGIRCFSTTSVVTKLQFIQGICFQKLTAC